MVVLGIHSKECVQCHGQGFTECGIDYEFCLKCSGSGKELEN